MTHEQNTRCHAIIHSAAVAAGSGNVLPVPGLGLAADTAALAGMAIGLAGVFGDRLSESVAKAMAVNAIKRAILHQPVKMVCKEFFKVLPVFGSVFAASVSVRIIEAAGWMLAYDLERQAA